MGESFTIQISSNLVRHLVDDGEKLKKKTKKPPKPKVSRESQPSQMVPPKQLPDNRDTHKGHTESAWPLQPPLYLPIPPPQRPENSELEAIRSVLQESENVVERLQKQEERMLEEVTQRAEDLREKEFKLPNSRLMPCLEEKDSCLNCYKEHAKDPHKCASFVKDFADCAPRVRQQVGMMNN